jgi:hypothetical protein
LTADELLAVAAELGTAATADVAELAAVQRADTLVDVVASLLVAIVRGRPFERRNGAVGVASADLLARLNGHALDLGPAEDTAAVIARIRDGLPAIEVRAWLVCRLAPRPTVAGPRCPVCSMPLREGLAVLPAGCITFPTCGGCGHLLSRPLRTRPRQELRCSSASPTRPASP